MRKPMKTGIGRRQAILLIGAASAFPHMARAQGAGPPTIGFLSIASPEAFAPLVAQFRDALAVAGYVEGRDVTTEYRWARGRYEALPELAADLVARKVALIVSSGGDRPTFAAKAATSTIPIIFIGSDDPVGLGLVQSLNRPGGNLTGGSLFTSELEAKKLELLAEILPGGRRFVLLVNPNNPTATSDIRDVHRVADALDREVVVVEARDEAGIDVAFALIGQSRPDGLLVGHDPFFNSQREQIVAQVTRLAIPAIYEHRQFVTAGGLMSYGNNIVENYRMAGVYVARVLKGAQPADLPVQQATRFEMVINQKTAAALNLALPPAILVRADDVIE